ncbi:unnamed protein product, partial [Discosporangium mesarthrocarpum]
MSMVKQQQGLATGQGQGQGMVSTAMMGRKGMAAGAVAGAAEAEVVGAVPRLGAAEVVGQMVPNASFIPGFRAPVSAGVMPGPGHAGVAAVAEAEAQRHAMLVQSTVGMLQEGVRAGSQSVGADALGTGAGALGAGVAGGTEAGVG